MPEGRGSGRRRLFTVAVALCGCALGLTAGSARSGSVIAADSTINVIYTTSSLQVKLDNGTVVGAGTTIPAGSYTIQVYDSGDFPTPKFSMTGPGVSVSSDLNSTGMGLDVPSTFGPFNLQTSSGYTITDSDMGASSRVAFGTSATATAGGSSGSGSSGGGGSGGSTSTGGGTSAGGGSSTGGKTVKTVATLAASVDPAGKPMLMTGGKSVTTLKAGLYKLNVADQSKKLGIVVGKVSKAPITLSGAATVGTSSRTVTLSAGTWYFAASATGLKTYFVVK